MAVPFFIFKNIDSRRMGCVIESELKDVRAEKREEIVKFTGRSGSFRKSYGDYDSILYPVEMSLLDFDNREDIKRWLSGSGTFILHHDVDKFREARVVGESLDFDNEWNIMSTFTITFELQPFRYKVRESPIDLTKGDNLFVNLGTEASFPLFIFKTSGGNMTITIENKTFTLVNTVANTSITLDCENGLCYRDGSLVITKGDFPRLPIGDVKVTIAGNFTSGTMKGRWIWT
ncbi:hypothetical protein HBP99_04280 [Listeria booriae]|uniref:hypothetical protein n=1 Tax=Listeria booriae TaxID=1552123 RepID=UPI001628366D|nr:hypothetical protein [Listeria booriae]MBC2367837.1 hypothetical protein [Listeria booriae]